MCVCVCLTVCVGLCLSVCVGVRVLDEDGGLLGKQTARGTLQMFDVFTH